MVLEAGIRNQRIDSMREVSGALPSGGVFVPFGNVVKRFSWAPDAAIEARRGIGSVDSLGFDTGPESHSCTVGYLLQGAQVVAATLLTGAADDDDFIQWTADKAGHEGNEITVTVVAGTADADGISVIDRDIRFETDATLTCDEAVALLNANTDVAALITCATTAATDAASFVQVAGIATLSAGESTPLAEAFNRDCDGQIEARTIVQRELHCDGGESDKGMRTYVVIEGAKPASARIPGDPGQAGPIEVEITYTAEKGRQYELSQPSVATVLYVASTESGDNAATITVQDDDGTQEEIVVSGTGSVVFQSIDACELASELLGTLTVQEGTSAGATLAVIRGSNDYANAEGDLGIPVLPTSGSRTATLTGTYEKFLGDTVEYEGSDLAYDINSSELSVDNSVEALPRGQTRKQRIVEGNRVVQINATVMGENEYQTQVTRHLKADAGDIVWTMTNNVFSLWGAVLTDPGDKSVEEGAAYMQFDNVFTGTSITLA